MFLLPFFGEWEVFVWRKVYFVAREMEEGTSIENKLVVLVK